MDKKQFDNIILNNLINEHGANKFGYKTKDGGFFPLYYQIMNLKILPRK